MFFADIIIVFIALLFFYLLWRIIVKPILKDRGIKVDEDKLPSTPHLKELKTLIDQYKKLSVSAQSAERGLILAQKIKHLKEKIQYAETESKKLRS